MVAVSLNNVGKKFSREWIFRSLNYEINAGAKIAILGGNGSGKSTLLQVISGFVTPNEGTVIYAANDGNVEPEKVKEYISFASPYLQLIEDFTLAEMVAHISLFKPFIGKMPAEDFIKLTELGAAKNKMIRQFSSGMKQRLKLALAILADTPVLLLDEPVSNLDRNAIGWYRQLMLAHSANRTVIVCSNAIEEEYFFCDTALDVTAYKN